MEETIEEALKKQEKRLNKKIDEIFSNFKVQEKQMKFFKISNEQMEIQKIQIESFKVETQKPRATRIRNNNLLSLYFDFPRRQSK